jgi:hypothetical protein
MKERFSFLPLLSPAMAALALAVILSGCGGINPTLINEINSSPVNFDGKGIVKDPTRLPLLGTKSYVLKDDSGEILVLTQADLPKMNEKISVKVKVANIAIINGESLGTMITEISRR